mgnify:CR=1 FL=1
MNKSLTYWDFGFDEYMYLATAYNKGIKRNAMVAQAQHITEYFLKELLNRQLLNNLPCMSGHNLRSLYDAVADTGIDIRPIRESVMALNNYYTHTRYPGRGAFLAKDEDIDSAVKHVASIYMKVKDLLK